MLLNCRPRHGMTLAVLCTSRAMKLQKKLSLYYTTVLYDMVYFMFKGIVMQENVLPWAQRVNQGSI